MKLSLDDFSYVSWFFQPNYLLAGRGKTAIWSIVDASKVAIYHILTLHSMNTFQPEVSRRKLIKRCLGKCLFDLLKSHCGQKTAIWPIFGACIHSRNLLHSKRLHEKNTFLPEMDRGKSMKLCLDSCFPGFYTLVRCDPGQKQQFDQFWMHSRWQFTAF